jgi:hypothetical protein
MMSSLNASEPDFKLFLKFYSDRFTKDRTAFIFKALHGDITVNNVAGYFTMLTNTYAPLYKKFQNIKKDYPSSVTEYTSNQPINPHNATAGCNPSCNNLDFSSGTFNGWNAYYYVGFGC